jgi:hypothetical protein
MIVLPRSSTSRREEPSARIALFGVVFVTISYVLVVPIFGNAISGQDANPIVGVIDSGLGPAGSKVALITFVSCITLAIDDIDGTNTVNRVETCAVVGIYISFQLAAWAVLIAKQRGWQARGVHTRRPGMTREPGRARKRRRGERHETRRSVSTP